jgi:hypothetical protein
MQHSVRQAARPLRSGASSWTWPASPTWPSAINPQAEARSAPTHTLVSAVRLTTRLKQVTLGARCCDEWRRRRERQRGRGRGRRGGRGKRRRRRRERERRLGRGWERNVSSVCSPQRLEHGVAAEHPGTSSGGGFLQLHRARRSAAGRHPQQPHLCARPGHHDDEGHVQPHAGQDGRVLPAAGRAHPRRGHPPVCARGSRGRQSTLPVCSKRTLIPRLFAHSVQVSVPVRTLQIRLFPSHQNHPIHRSVWCTGARHVILHIVYRCSPRHSPRLKLAFLRVK